MRHHIAHKCPHTRKLLRLVAWHFIDQRPFSVYNLIMGNRQNKVFGKGINERKGDIVVIEFTVNRIKRHIMQHIVHPAHVPLVVEAQPAAVRRLGNHRP